MRREENPGKEPISERRRRNRGRYYRYEVITFVLMLAVVYLVCAGVVRYVGQKTLVDGASMSPTLEDGDVLIVEKLSYRFRQPDLRADSIRKIKEAKADEVICIYG